MRAVSPGLDMAMHGVRSLLKPESRKGFFHTYAPSQNDLQVMEALSGKPTGSIRIDPTGGIGNWLRDKTDKYVGGAIDSTMLPVDALVDPVKHPERNEVAGVLVNAPQYLAREILTGTADQAMRAIDWPSRQQRAWNMAKNLTGSYLGTGD